MKITYGDIKCISELSVELSDKGFFIWAAIAYESITVPASTVKEYTDFRRKKIKFLKHTHISSKVKCSFLLKHKVASKTY